MGGHTSIYGYDHATHRDIPGERDYKSLSDQPAMAPPNNGAEDVQPVTEGGAQPDPALRRLRALRPRRREGQQNQILSFRTYEPYEHHEAITYPVESNRRRT